MSESSHFEGEARRSAKGLPEKSANVNSPENYSLRLSSSLHREMNSASKLIRMRL